ncbi:hypothetical protein SLE2022_122000 [Rubroshorea leprosula]
MEKNHTSKSYPMVGEGLHSYATNSGHQKMGLDSFKRLMHEEITKKLDVAHLLSSNSNLFRIADMGCSSGPNAFFVVQYIIEAVKSVSQSKDIEFEVFFNMIIVRMTSTLFLGHFLLKEITLQLACQVPFMSACSPRPACILFTHHMQSIGFQKFQNKSKTKPPLRGTKGGSVMEPAKKLKMLSQYNLRMILSHS